jgi:hypothetical protein
MSKTCKTHTCWPDHKLDGRSGWIDGGDLRAQDDARVGGGGGVLEFGAKGRHHG